MDILIVDDDFTIRELLKECLKNYSSEFFEAENFQNAFDLLISAQKFDLIILDNNLPDGLGIHLVEMAALKTPNVIMFTADAADCKFKEKALLLKSRACVIKKYFFTYTV